MVAWFAKASVSHSVDFDLRQAMDRIRVGETYPLWTCSIFIWSLLPQMCVISMNKMKGYLCLASKGVSCTEVQEGLKGICWTNIETFLLKGSQQSCGRIFGYMFWFPVNFVPYIPIWNILLLWEILDMHLGVAFGPVDSAYGPRLRSSDFFMCGAEKFFPWEMHTQCKPDKAQNGIFIFWPNKINFIWSGMSSNAQLIPFTISC